MGTEKNPHGGTPFVLVQFLFSLSASFGFRSIHGCLLGLAAQGTRDLICLRQHQKDFLPTVFVAAKQEELRQTLQFQALSLKIVMDFELMLAYACSNWCSIKTLCAFYGEDAV
ncbi:hypothetical protein AAG906_003227 [Vitis piasezkii]